MDTDIHTNIIYRLRQTDSDLDMFFFAMSFVQLYVFDI